MKILQVFDFFSPYGGGTVDALYKLSKGLEQREHKVTICASDTKNYKFSQDYINSLKNVDVRIFHCWSNLFGFYIIPDIITKIDVRDYDVIHFHCFRSFQHVVLSRKARKHHIPYIIDAHGSTIRLSGFKQNLKKLYDIVFGTAVMDGASRFVAETSVGVDEYGAIGISPDRITIIHPPFDVGEFDKLPPMERFKAVYHIKGKHMILFIGRIHQIKGLDFLVRSFRKLCDERDDTVLAIVGNDDGYLGTLMDLVKSLNLIGKVIFTGFLSGEVKLSALVDADVLVQPSLYEQGARPSFEAILCNVPAIVTKNTGAGKDIEEIDGGYLVDYGDTLGLSQAMQSVIDYPIVAQSKVRKAQKWIRDNLSLDGQVKKYEQLYKEVAGK